MNQFIKQVIEEKFVSKKQHKFFFAKANEKGVSKKEKKKWGEWAKEFSDKTDFKKLPEKVEKETEMDEIVASKMRENSPPIPSKTISTTQYIVLSVSVVTLIGLTFL